MEEHYRFPLKDRVKKRKGSGGGALSQVLSGKMHVAMANSEDTKECRLSTMKQAKVWPWLASP